jgi:DnaJ-class molecular chaperone
MTWDWKKTIQGKDDSGPVVTGPVPRRKRSAAGPPRCEGPSGIREDAGIVLGSTGTPHLEARPGDPPKLLYGKEYDCAFCRGWGQWPNDSLCPVCRGTGNVSVPAPAVQCAFCRGRGQVPQRTSLTCCVCKGKGIVAVTPPVRICPDCGGRGKKRGQSLYCARCRGAGVVTSRQSSADCRGVSSDIATECNLERKAS